jgi:hypothetical protein
MVVWWTSPAYWKKHDDAKARRALMGGGSHTQGSISLQNHWQKTVSTNIIYSIHEGSPSLILYSLSCRPFSRAIPPRSLDITKEKERGIAIASRSASKTNTNVLIREIVRVNIFMHPT